MDETLAERLRAESESKLPPPPTEDELAAREAAADRRKEAYAEEWVPKFIDILTQKAQKANAEGKKRTSMEWQVGIGRRSELQHAMLLVGQHFVEEGFAVTSRERDNRVEPLMRNDYDLGPGIPATEFTVELAVDWSKPVQPPVQQ